jgi:hypothetical protein
VDGAGEVDQASEEEHQDHRRDGELGQRLAAHIASIPDQLH